jgi:hypothetical protein
MSPLAKGRRLVIPVLTILLLLVSRVALADTPQQCFSRYLHAGEIIQMNSNGMFRLKETNYPGCATTFYRASTSGHEPMTIISINGMGAQISDIKPGMRCSVILRKTAYGYGSLAQTLNCNRLSPPPAPTPSTPAPAPAPTPTPTPNAGAPGAGQSPPPAPTYGPPTPAPTSGNLLRWVRGPNVPVNSVIGGQEPGRQLPVCRAAYQTGVHPGKVIEGKCYIGWGGSEIALAGFEILTSDGVNLGWIAGPAVPGNAVIGGQEPGRQLAVCRTAYSSGVHPGKVIEGRCFIGYGGQEVALPSFEVLVTR